jgi:hypothetical protein
MIEPRSEPTLLGCLDRSAWYWTKLFAGNGRGEWIRTIDGPEPDKRFLLKPLKTSRF